MRSYLFSAAFLGWFWTAYAGIATQCVTSDVCFSLNIPDNTVSSGGGDIYVQISAPTSYSWVSVSQGTQMSGANYFVIYTSSSGTNVTLSPRSGSGHNTPSYNSAVQATLLDGSGVSNGVMTANIKCTNCNSWSGGSMDLTSSSTHWIWGFKTGSALNSDSMSASISEHNKNGYGSISFDSTAQGGSDSNPFLSGAVNVCSSSASSGAVATSAAASGATSSAASSAPSVIVIGSTGTVTNAFPSRTSTPSESHTKTKTRDPRPTQTDDAKIKFKRSYRGLTAEQIVKRATSPACTTTTSSGASAEGSNGTLSKRNMLLIAHGVMACFAFAFLFPIGGILIRLASFPGLLWVHSAMQVFGYLIYTAAFALGAYIATHPDSGDIENKHPIIGILLFALLFFQAPFGYLHHKGYKRVSGRTNWSYLHLWTGRIAITLGIINGGFGFQLSDNTNLGLIIYSIVAAIIWIAYVASIFIGERRRARARATNKTALEGDQENMVERSFGPLPPIPTGGLLQNPNFGQRRPTNARQLSTEFAVSPVSSDEHSLTGAPTSPGASKSLRAAARNSRRLSGRRNSRQVSAISEEVAGEMARHDSWPAGYSVPAPPEGFYGRSRY